MYNKQPPISDRTKVAWKRIHGDVFRKPRRFLELTVLVGTGVQLSFMAFVTLLFSSFTRPQAMTGMLTVFLPLFSFLNGYISSVYYRFFRGSAWVTLSLNSALVYPLFLAVCYLVISSCDQNVANTLLGGTEVSLMPIAFLLCFLNLPSTVVGTVGGFLSEEMKIPVKSNRLRRVIPD